MSTSVSPTESTGFPGDQLTIIVASFSCLVFFVVIVVLLSLLFRKDPLCCKARSYQSSHGDLEAPSQYYSSRQTLVSACAELPHNTRHDDSNSQSGQLFYVGLPSTYHLPALDPPLPRLPSYESVRKKDRQRQIHMMIADRFGLNGPTTEEPPPTYEESIRQSLQSLDVPFDTVTTGDETPHAQVQHPHPPLDALPRYEALPQTFTSPDPNYSPQPD